MTMLIGAQSFCSRAAAIHIEKEMWTKSTKKLSNCRMFKISIKLMKLLNLCKRISGMPNIFKKTGMSKTSKTCG
jgi:hypothetical protein